MLDKYFKLCIALFLTVSCGKSEPERRKESPGNKHSQSEKNSEDGGPCKYNSFEGSAEFLTISEKKPKEVDAMWVSFNFYPSNEEYLLELNLPYEDGRVTFAAINYLKSCIFDNKINAGTFTKMIIKRIKKGTCTPLILELPEMEDQKCKKM